MMYVCMMLVTYVCVYILKEFFYLALDFSSVLFLLFSCPDRRSGWTSPHHISDFTRRNHTHSLRLVSSCFAFAFACPAPALDPPLPFIYTVQPTIHPVQGARPGLDRSPTCLPTFLPYQPTHDTTRHDMTRYCPYPSVPNSQTTGQPTKQVTNQMDTRL